MSAYTFVYSLLLVCLPIFTMGQGVLTLSIAGNDAKCNGSTNGSVIATPSGGVAPYSYLWTPAIGVTDTVSGLAAGTYSVTVTDSNGNTISGSVTINQPAPLIVNIDSIVVPSGLCAIDGLSCGCGNTLWAVVSGGTPPYSYLWGPGGLTGDTVSGACYLEWTVNVTDSNNCVTGDSLDVVSTPRNVIVVTTGVNQLSNTPGINVYPNPAGNQLNISINPPVADAGNIEVYDMAGRKVLEHTLAGNAILVSLDISGLADGNYLLRIANDESQTTHFSILR